MNKILKKVLYSVLIVMLIAMPLVKTYAIQLEGTDVNSGEGKSLMQEIFGFANNFANSSGDDTTAAQALKEAMSKIISGIASLVFYVGNFIFFMATITLGIKYMVESSQGKASVKGNLANLAVGIIFFYSAQLVFEFANGTFTEMFQGGTAETVMTTAFGTFIAFAKVAAYTAVLMLGIRYIFANPNDRGRLKSQLLPFAIGAMLVFATTTMINFVINIGGDLL